MRMDIAKAQSIQRTIHNAFPDWMIERVWYDMYYVWVVYNPFYSANVCGYIRDMVALFADRIILEDDEADLIRDSCIKFPIGRI